MDFCFLASGNSQRRINRYYWLFLAKKKKKSIPAKKISILHNLDLIDFRNWKCIKFPGDRKLTGFVIIITDKRFIGWNQRSAQFSLYYI